jgi:hypothetical protein
LWLIGGVTAIALLSMYGIFMEIAVRGDWPVFFGLGNPSTNAVSNVVYQLYTSDIAITALGLLLLLIAQVLLQRLDSASGQLPRRGMATAAQS